MALFSSLCHIFGVTSLLPARRVSVFRAISLVQHCQGAGWPRHSHDGVSLHNFLYCKSLDFVGHSVDFQMSRCRSLFLTYLPGCTNHILFQPYYYLCYSVLCSSSAAHRKSKSVLKFAHRYTSHELIQQDFGV